MSGGGYAWAACHGRQPEQETGHTHACPSHPACVPCRPFQFGSNGWADLYYPQMAANGGFAMHWYALNVESPDSWMPGAVEAEHPERGGARGDKALLRDRHVLLPPAALQAMLLRIAAAGRSRPRYLAQRQEGLHYAELLEGGSLRPAAMRTRGAPAKQAGISGDPSELSGEASALPMLAAPSATAVLQQSTVAATEEAPLMPAATPQPGSEQCAERGLNVSHPLLAAWQKPAFMQPWGQRCLEYRRVCFDQVRGSRRVRGQLALCHCALAQAHLHACPPRPPCPPRPSCARTPSSRTTPPTAPPAPASRPCPASTSPS